MLDFLTNTSTYIFYGICYTGMVSATALISVFAGVNAYIYLLNYFGGGRPPTSGLGGGRPPTSGLGGGGGTYTPPVRSIRDLRSFLNHGRRLMIVAEPVLEETEITSNISKAIVSHNRNSIENRLNTRYYESFLDERSSNIANQIDVPGPNLTSSNLKTLWLYYNTSIGQNGSPGPTFESFVATITSEENRVVLDLILRNVVD